MKYSKNIYYAHARIMDSYWKYYDCRVTELGTDIWNIRSFPFNWIFYLGSKLETNKSIEQNVNIRVQIRSVNSTIHQIYDNCHKQ